MQTTSQTASHSASSPHAAEPSRSSDLIYQAITLVSALLLLGSLWVF